MTTLTTRWTVLGAALGLAGVLALPKGTGSEADELAIIAAAPERFLVGNALTFAATALIGIGLLVLARGCAGHGHRGTAVLLRIAAAGWLLHTALIAHNAVSYELAAMDDRGAATELAAQIYAGPVFLGLLLPMLALTVLGMVAAGVALWRTGHAPPWAAAALALALVSDFVTPETFSGIPMFGLLLLAFLGLREARDRHAVPAGVEPAHAA